jgi:ketosteroid isomerase-like protein
MPEDIVEIVRRAYEAGTRRPKPDLETVNALYHRDHELVTPLSRLEGATYDGMAGFREWFSSREEDWDALTFELEQAVQVDDERVLVAARFTGRGKRGGVRIEEVQGLVMTVRDGRVVRTEAFSTVEDAVAATCVTDSDRERVLAELGIP